MEDEKQRLVAQIQQLNEGKEQHLISWKKSKKTIVDLNNKLFEAQSKITDLKSNLKAMQMQIKKISKDNKVLKKKCENKDLKLEDFEQRMEAAMQQNSNSSVQNVCTFDAYFFHFC